MEKTTKTTNTYIVTNGKQFNNELSRILKAIKLETLEIVAKDEKKALNNDIVYKNKVLSVFGHLNLDNPKARAHIEFYETLNAWKRESKSIINSVTSLYIDQDEQTQANALNFVKSIVKCVNSQLSANKRYSKGFERLYYAWMSNNKEMFNNAFHVLYGIHCDDDTITRIDALGLGNNKILSLNAFRNVLNSALCVVLKHQGKFSIKEIKSSIANLLKEIKIYKTSEIYTPNGDFLVSALDSLITIYNLENELPKNPRYENKCTLVKRELINKKVVVMPNGLANLEPTKKLNVQIENLSSQVVKKALGNTKETKQETQENK